MNSYENIIAYLWLLPVTVLIVIPLFWSLFTWLYRVIQRTRLVEVEGCILENAGNLEKRNNQRIRLDEGHAHIDGKSDCCKIDVSDVSTNGICLKHIPEGMDLRSNSFMVMFRTPEQDYTFDAKPIWKKQTERGYVVGAEIIKAPYGWDNMLEGFDQTCIARDFSVQ